MTLFENFLIIAALICTFSGCANISMDSAEASSTVLASSDSSFSDAESTVGGTIYFDYDKYESALLVRVKTMMYYLSGFAHDQR